MGDIFPPGQGLTPFLPPGETRDRGGALTNLMLPGMNEVFAAGAGAQPFWNYPIDLSVNRSAVPLVLEFFGDYVEYNDSTNATDKLLVAYDTATGPSRYFYRGSTFSGPRFRRLFVFHPAIVGATGYLLLAKQFKDQTSLASQSS
jgi:hypothetical protein